MATSVRVLWNGPSSVAQPEIFNPDQGAQFTSQVFTGLLLGHGIKLRMDGRGRARDNIFGERLWRSVTYEEVYLHTDQHVPAASSGPGNYFNFYNRARLQQSLAYKTPEAVYKQLTG